jgi:hypothetical protein
MTYSVDVNNPVLPTNSQGAKQGAEELRAVKGKLLTYTAVASASASVRNAIQSAGVDVNGYNNALSAGAGLRISLAATVTPYQLSYASGFLGGKAINDEESILADIADTLGVDLPVSNTSFIFRTFGTGFRTTLVPKQEGYIFDRNKQSLMNFEGTNGAVVTTDDFGNVVTLTGATISTAQFKFGTSSLSIAAAGQFADVAFVPNPDGSWELSGWVRFTAVPGGAVIYPILSIEPANGFGAIVAINGNAGVPKLTFYVSSDGATYNISNGTVFGATTIVNATQYRIRLIFDALAGNYKLFLSNNGAAETTEVTVASVVKLCNTAKLRIGRCAQAGFTDLGTGGAFIDAVRFLSCATKTVVETPIAVAPAVTDHPVTFFNIPKMEHREVTAPSTISATDPVLSKSSSLFLGEADTSGAAVTAVRNYAIKGEFVGTWTTPTPANSITIVRNHNIGSNFVKGEVELQNLIANIGYVPGDIISDLSVQDATPLGGALTLKRFSRNSIGFISGSAQAFILQNATTGAFGSISNSSNFQYRVLAKRTF